MEGIIMEVIRRIATEDGLCMTVIECSDCVQSSGYVRDNGRYAACDTCNKSGVVTASVIAVTTEGSIV
mgnify:CR=1 FL=1